MKKQKTLKHSEAVAGWTSITYDKETGEVIKLGTIWVWCTSLPSWSQQS